MRFIKKVPYLLDLAAPFKKYVRDICFLTLIIDLKHCDNWEIWCDDSYRSKSF